MASIQEEINDIKKFLLLKFANGPIYTTLTELRPLINKNSINDFSFGGLDTFLHSACENLDFENVKWAIENGADVRIKTKDRRGYTPIMCASASWSHVDKKDKTKIIDYLVENGADISDIDLIKVPEVKEKTLWEKLFKN